MTTPIVFRDESVEAPLQQSVSIDDAFTPILERDGDAPLLPPPIIEVDPERMEKFKAWLDENLQTLIFEQAEKQKEWSQYEEDFRARPEAWKTEPFEGADNTVIPVIAMAVDPVVARLHTGIFQQDPVFRAKALKKSFVKIMPSIEHWIEYYQRHKLKLSQVMGPRLLEHAKLGTFVLKTVFDIEEHPVKTYDENFEVVEKLITKFKGPRVFGIELGSLLFNPGYQTIQDCPIVAERQYSSWWDLKVAESAGKLANVDKVKGQETPQRTELETAQQQAAAHVENASTRYGLIENFEIWCKYDIDGDDLPERLVVTYHKDTQTIMQLRYNWYFHQRYPYTVTPYAITSKSIYGLGLAEATKPFQDAITKWHQMATDNAYLANIRMFIAKKDSGIEEVPRLYTGRVFFVDDPSKDFIPFGAGDIYQSTIIERQNLFGMVEKRSGISDYLTGRESPVLGSRATATGTLALIEQGTKRVEHVLENVRTGLSEVLENCMYIWIQYGLGDLDDIVFGGDVIADDLREFFGQISAENVNGAIAIDLSVTDAGTSRQVMQQMQLQLIQIMMQYLEKLLQAGAEAIAAMKQGSPEFAEMVKDVMTAARMMFKDLLHKYDIRNPEEYLPDIGDYLNGSQVSRPPAAAGGGGAGPEAAIAGLLGGLGGAGGLPGGPAAPSVPTAARPATIGGGR